MTPKSPYDGLKELHNTDTHNCFACSPANDSGLQMKFFTDEKRVYSWVKVPEHMGGWNNIIHGGIVSAILDETMGWAGIYLLEQVTLTKTLTVDFIKAVNVGEQLRIEGWVQKRTGKREAVVSGIMYNAMGEICAESKGIFTLLSPVLAKRIGVMNDDHINAFFEPLMKSKAT